MKNLLKVLGIIAMVAIVGFSMTACGDDDNDDDNNGDDGILWAGTWKMTTTDSGSTPTDPYTFTLATNGGAWTFGNSNPNSSESGTSWKIDYTGYNLGPALVLDGPSGSLVLALIYEKITITKIRVFSSYPYGSGSITGIYEKQGTPD